MSKREEENWLLRWAQRKAQQKAPRATEAPQRADAVGDASPDGTAKDSAVPESIAPADSPGRQNSQDPVQDPVEALPPVESLTYESDFTPYLAPGVPEELRQQALRKLWRSDPVLANLDGLNDYDEDYSMIGKLEEVVETFYQAGQRMVGSVEGAANNSDSNADKSAGTAIEGSPRANDSQDKSSILRKETKGVPGAAIDGSQEKEEKVW